MTYVVIETDGTVLDRVELPASERISQEVGGPWDMTRSTQLRMAAFLHDTGVPDGLPRNLLGSVLMACSFFHVQPYHGPIVLTGWDEYGEPTEVVDLNPEVVRLLHRLMTDIKVALGQEPPEAASLDCTEEWQTSVRGLAETLRAAPDPGMTLLTISKDGAVTERPINLGTERG